MCDFQPGDVVVCVEHVKNTKGWPGEVVPVKGQNYAVLDVFRKPNTDIILVEVSGAPAGASPNKGRSGWKHHLFRRVYRPDGSFIAKCLEPVDLVRRVKA